MYFKLNSRYFDVIPKNNISKSSNQILNDMPISVQWTDIF